MWSWVSVLLNGLNIVIGSSQTLGDLCGWTTVLVSITVIRGFSTAALFTFWVKQFFVVGCCPVHCGTCTIPGLLDANSIAPSPNCDNQKCLQILSSIPSGAKLSLVEKPFKLNWTLGFWNQLTLKDLFKTKQN